MKKNDKPYINTLLFTKPPPNFKDSSSNWQSFKIPPPPPPPPPPSAKPLVPRKYTTEQHSNSVRNYKNEHPNYPSGSSFQKSTLPQSPEKSYDKNNSMFNSSSSNWQSFKVPHPPSSARFLVPKKHTTEPHSNSVRNYKNETPPNYPSSRSFQKSTLPPSIKQSYDNDNSVFNSASMVQPFKPNIPPPPFNKYSSHMLKSHNNLRTSMPETFDEDKNNCYYIIYRYPNSINTAQFPPNPNSFSTSPSSKPYSLPLHALHFPPPQPPLPPLPPPQAPPPPPPPPPPCSMSPSTSMTGQSHFGYYHKMSPYPMYGHGYSTMHSSYKRKFEGTDTRKKSQKKKKRPLSQVLSQRRGWTMEEAKKALEVEKECNKKFKKKGLVIMFPDIEVNRDIVSKFHTSIECVHFQQPSAPRYCFVTLTESADPETVMKQLNQIPFGQGHLTAEFKKDRDDEQNMRLIDIDPLTLYVGNLAPEITKEDMIKTYPKHKRIDIGYAKKMKYTRYAFVSFNLVDDAIEACRNTHSSQMYSKSLIVRFRRLHGTVGMSGEPQQQFSQPLENKSMSVSDSANSSLNEEDEGDKVHDPWDIDVSHWENDYEETKCKRSDSSPSEDEDVEKPDIKSLPPVLYKTNFRPGSVEVAFSLHQPKVHIKEDHEVYEDNPDHTSSVEKEDSVSSISDSSSVKLENPQLNVERENLGSQTEIQTVGETSKQEVTDNSTQSSITSYQYLRKLNQQVRVGQSPVAKLHDVVNVKKEEENTVKEQGDAAQENSQSNLTTNNNNLKESLLTNNGEASASDSATADTEIPVPNSSNAQHGIDTQELRDVVHNESTSSCNESEKTGMNETSDTAFGWMNMDYSTTVIKTERTEDDQARGGDEDSSDDDLSMENIIRRAKTRCRKTNSF